MDLDSLIKEHKKLVKIIESKDSKALEKELLEQKKELEHYIELNKKSEAKKVQSEKIKRKDGSYSERGLWDNIRDKQKRGEKPRKPGDKGAPTKKSFEKSKTK